LSQSLVFLEVRKFDINGPDTPPTFGYPKLLTPLLMGKSFFFEKEDAVSGRTWIVFEA
tara:strand:- start:73 stop:246 length:174 start_codon:yes stop_codon:yes gene_type:complete